MVVLPGFLLIFFISGTSALRCCFFNSATDFDTTGNPRLSIYGDEGSITCSSDKNACLAVQVKLYIDRTPALLTYGDCVHWDPHNRSESTTSGDQHFVIHSNVSYCFHDLCNVPTNPGNVSATPGEEANGTNYCYSGFNLGINEPLEKVRCHEGYNSCYQSTCSVVFGTPGNSYQMYIKTCQRPACTVPQHQSFGLVTINIKSDSCCVGSYCNAKEDASTNESYSGRPAGHNTPVTTHDVGGGLSLVPGIGVVPSEHHWDGKPIRAPVDVHVEHHSDGGDGTESKKFFDHSIPIVASAGGPILQICLLLVALGITVLGVWW